MKKVARLAFGIVMLVSAAVRAEESKSDRPASPDRSELFKSVSKNLSQGKPIELEALEIRARIYEPQVVYILDRAKVDVQFREEEVKFSSRIIEPIEDNDL